MLLMEEATRAWHEAPRESGPDLFSVAGFIIPEFLTRPPNGSDDVNGDQSKFENVDCNYATVADFVCDTQIKLRNSSPKVGQQAKATEEIIRRAKGDMNRFLRDLADEPAAGGGGITDL